MPAVRLEAGRFVVAGWPEAAELPPERWRDVFAVYVDSGDQSAPALLGSYKLENGSLIFEPRFPLEPGLRYRAVLRTEPPLVARFEIPRVIRPATRVEALYPTTDRIPENQLKLYVHFSAPMSRGEAYRHVRLLGEDGKTIELPFLELDQELWDPSGTRFTLLFDPGRIKRGLVPHQDVGPPLEAGRRYTLVIDAAWRDAERAPLAAEFRREFRVAASDRIPPDPRRWRITAPAAGTTQPLVVDFGEPLDRALLERCLTVTGVNGTTTIEEQETRWRFTPTAPWKQGAHTLAIDTALEDLAGNRIGKPFDVDRFERVDKETRHKLRRLPFKIH